MKNEKSKKVVIIQDIKSDAIEQAILILRNSGQVKPAPVGYHIVTEAQNIIDSYIQTVESSKTGLKQVPSISTNPDRKGRFKKRLFYISGALLVLASSIYIGISILNSF